MIEQSVQSYRERIADVLSRRRPGLDAVHLAGDSHRLERAVESERSNHARLLRRAGVRLAIVRQFIAPLFPHEPDIAFLSSRESKELLDILFDITLQILRWQSNGEPDTEPVPRLSSPSVRDYHQQPCTPATARRRADLVKQYWEGPAPPSILLLGDDDLVSLSLAKAAGWSSTVLEIDPKVQALIESASAHDASITVIPHDLRTRFPDRLRERFSVVMADPMYTAEGLQMILDGALSALAPEPSGLLFLSFNETLAEKGSLSVAMKDLEDNHFRLIQRLPRFNVYPVPSMRQRQLKTVARFLLPDVLLRTMMEIPMTFSDMFIFRRIRNGA